MNKKELSEKAIKILVLMLDSKNKNILKITDSELDVIKETCLSIKKSKVNNKFINHLVTIQNRNILEFYNYLTDSVHYFLENSTSNTKKIIAVRIYRNLITKILLNKGDIINKLNIFNKSFSYLLGIKDIMKEKDSKEINYYSSIYNFIKEYNEFKYLPNISDLTNKKVFEIGYYTVIAKNSKGITKNNYTELINEYTTLINVFMLYETKNTNDTKVYHNLSDYKNQTIDKYCDIYNRENLEFGRNIKRLTTIFNHLILTKQKNIADKIEKELIECKNPLLNVLTSNVFNFIMKEKEELNPNFDLRYVDKTEEGKNVFYLTFNIKPFRSKDILDTYDYIYKDYFFILGFKSTFNFTSDDNELIKKYSERHPRVIYQTKGYDIYFKINIKQLFRLVDKNKINSLNKEDKILLERITKLATSIKMKDSILDILFVGNNENDSLTYTTVIDSMNKYVDLTEKSLEKIDYVAEQILGEGKESLDNNTLYYILYDRVDKKFKSVSSDMNIIKNLLKEYRLNENSKTKLYAGMINNAIENKTVLLKRYNIFKAYGKDEKSVLQHMSVKNDIEESVRNKPILKITDVDLDFNTESNIKYFKKLMKDLSCIKPSMEEQFNNFNFLDIVTNDKILDFNKNKITDLLKSHVKPEFKIEFI